MLLTHVIATWAKQQNIEVHAFTVDHGVRTHSLYESHIVARWLKRLYDIPVEVLRGTLPLKTVSMSQARQMRYDLLFAACRRLHIKHLCLGHHLTDQIETFYMRYEKGSGLQGLAGMPFSQSMAGINLIRPFLHITREEILEKVMDLNLPHINEPTNQNTTYTRNAFRHMYTEVIQGTQFRKRFLKNQESIRYKVSLIDQTIKDFLEKIVQYHPLGFLRIQLTLFFGLNVQAQHGILKRLLRAMHGFHHIKESALQRVCEKMQVAEKQTVSGCIIVVKKEWAIIMREPRSLPLPQILAAEDPFFWDNRFFIDPSAALHVYSGITIHALGKTGVKKLKEFRRLLRHIPAYVLESLPAIWHGDQLLSIPPLSGRPGQLAIQCAFMPRVIDEKLYMEF